jgi:hypothetical protein
MKTTKKRNRVKDAAPPPTPFTLAGMVDKTEVGFQLGMLTGDDDLSALVFYERDWCIHPDGRNPDKGSEGHVFRVEFDGEHCDDICLDDRQGDLRLLLADQLEQRGKKLLEMAAAYRDHAKGVADA